MEKFKKFIRSPYVTVCAFVLAAGLLIFSSVGGARAALTYYSENYTSQMELFDIGVTLMENGEDISWRNYGEEANGEWAEHTGELVQHMLDGEEKLTLGKPYTEELTIRNSGKINHYARVRIYKYWINADGTKRQDLDPAFINLHLVNLDSSWIEDEASRTPERTVLYYNKLLMVDEIAPLFSDKLTIDGRVAFLAHQYTAADGSIVTVYDYDGVQFVIEAKVDAVQENNAAAAALSAWGERVSIDEEAGTLSLN